MANPTGNNVVPVRTPITGAWTRVDNPNNAQGVDVVCDVDIEVRYEQTAPGMGDAGFLVPANVIYGYRSDRWLGWTKSRPMTYYPLTDATYSPLWARRTVAGNSNLDSNWIRE
jgi:hypothetical protein